MEKNFDFSGWCTKANVRCSDGLTIMKDAFKHNDGKKVPLVWNHQHNNVENVLGYALLENREEGVYAYGKLNNSKQGQLAKELIMHGDIDAMSIYANKLKKQGSNVVHGELREVSLVLAGANPGAHIDSIMCHSDDGEDNSEAGIIYSGEDITLFHSEDEEEIEVVEAEEEKKEDVEDVKEVEENIEHAAGGEDKGETQPMAEENKTAPSKRSNQEIWDGLKEDEKNLVYSMIGQVLEENENKKSEGEDKDMKHNVFEKDETQKGEALAHAHQVNIINLAKTSAVGSLRAAMEQYANENSLKHGFDEKDENYGLLFPDYKNLNPGAPELIRQDQSWVMTVINKIKKSPFARIRTRQADARIAELRAKGYQKKGDKKEISAQIKLLTRTTDPQTVYRKDELHRDDIIDITDFDYVAYQWGIMKDNICEEIALAALVGDRRDDGDPDKIHQENIRSIWNDDDLYTIHYDVDIEGMRETLQGTETDAHFGENYIYAEAMIQAALYSREQFKGTGTPDLYCAPHLVNIMLLARDLNGRRIYDSKADLAKALNVGAIYEIEQFEGLVRTDKKGAQKKLLGLFVNLSDYQFGSTKGGELTKFEDFDIDFNKYKYLIETRLSGALTKPFAAIALEEPVTEEAGE